MTQLRGADVIERDGIHGLRITPEAGTVKNKKTRVVPIHDHLIEQGFLEFVKKHGAGPMFYRVANKMVQRSAESKEAALHAGQTASC